MLFMDSPFYEKFGFLAFLMLLDYVEYDIDIKLTKVMLNISVKDFLRILQLTPPSLSIKDIHSNFFKSTTFGIW